MSDAEMEIRRPVRPACRGSAGRRSIRRSRPARTCALQRRRRLAGPRITVPSSLVSSDSTPTGGRPASRQRSTQASVWPERISTPPCRATSGNTWPGRTKSEAPLLSLASARTVLQRSSAEMPVVRPWRTSTVTVKAVPSGASFSATIGIEMQPARMLGAERRADDAGGVADDERHLLRRAKRGGDEQIALVLAVVVVGDDHDLAFGEGLDRGVDSAVAIGHALTSRAASAKCETATPSPRPSGRDASDSDRPARMPPWLRRSAPRGYRRKDRGGLWSTTSVSRP